ncbi:hypothetical protein GGI12_006231 [Dipsacomyces acuminosporus]|nr:hypothetical protein GGI12_006231 [Dipsacomyces acuminosporus]
MAGYFALRLLAAHHITPRLPFDNDRTSATTTTRWLRIITYTFFAASVVWAWLYSIRRPYILYSIANAISAWLALVQFVDFPLRMLGSRKNMPASSRNSSPERTPAPTPDAGSDAADQSTFSASASGNGPLSKSAPARFNDRLDRKLR